MPLEEFTLGKIPPGRVTAVESNKVGPMVGGQSSQLISVIVRCSNQKCGVLWSSKQHNNLTDVWPRDKKMAVAGRYKQYHIDALVRQAPSYEAHEVHIVARTERVSTMIHEEVVD